MKLSKCNVLVASFLSTLPRSLSLLFLKFTLHSIIIYPHSLRHTSFLSFISLPHINCLYFPSLFISSITYSCVCVLFILLFVSASSLPSLPVSVYLSISNAAHKHSLNEPNFAQPSSERSPSSRGQSETAASRRWRGGGAVTSIIEIRLSVFG